MAQKKTKEEDSNVGKVVAIGAGVAALSVGAYILFGPNGKKNQKNLKGWAIKMKGEIIEKLEAAKEVTAPVYDKVVSEIAEKYGKLQHVNPGDLELEVANLKKHWKALTKSNTKKGAPKKALNAPKKSSKTVAKKNS